MPRKARMYLLHIPTHIVQRGNNRNTCFFAEDDFYFYKQALAEWLKRYGAALHAYCFRQTMFTIDLAFCNRQYLPDSAAY